MINEEEKVTESIADAPEAVINETNAAGERAVTKEQPVSGEQTAGENQAMAGKQGKEMPTVKAAGNTSEKAVENAAEKPKSRKRDILETVLYLAVVVGICLLFIRFVAYRCVVEGSSMEHYLEDKDNLIAERVTYYFRKPERFEVIIFKREGESRHGQEKGDSLIKRIIGLPGETVSISNGKVSING